MKGCRTLYNFTEAKSRWGGGQQRQDPCSDRSTAPLRSLARCDESSAQAGEGRKISGPLAPRSEAKRQRVEGWGEGPRSLRLINAERASADRARQVAAELRIGGGDPVERVLQPP